MNVWVFWAAAGGLALMVAGVLVAALRRGEIADDSDPDLAIYKDQLAEVARDLARGTITEAEAERLRAEVARRVLEADRQGQAAAAGSAGPSLSRPRGRAGAWVAGALVLAAVVPGGAAVYWGLGAPGYPDMALQPRLAALDAAMADRPAQAEMLAAQGRARDAGADAALVERLAGVTDPEALRAEFQAHFEASRMAEAVRVQERLIAVLGEAASSADHANLALALFFEADGYVSPEAEAALRASLLTDLANEPARWLVGEMFLQAGRYDQAFRFWRPLVEAGSPAAADAPWTRAIRDRIERVAELAGVRYVLPDAAGPSAGDIAAADGMAPEDRQAMIEGMVAQLSDRLATEGGDVEDWEQLIRSLIVLERLDEAQRIYDEAMVRFDGRPAELSFLRMTAVEGGLSP
jgi:cytochrome c-type biogenesis protein CcmH